MNQLAKDNGLARESIYRHFPEKGNPNFATIFKVVNALGLKLHVGTTAHTA